MEEDSSPSYGQNERALWTAVVLKALDDIANEPLDSTDYTDAGHFFTSGGEWAASRADIALHLDFHPDDLARAGRNSINQRRVADGMPAEIVPAKVSTPHQQTPLPRLGAIPPVPTGAEQRARRREKRDRNWWIANFMAKSAA
jgi:hypothetical protein